VNKVIRALEITLLARRPASELFRQGKDPLTGFRRLLIGLDPPRKALYARLDERCRLMFEHGLLDEVRGIEARGYSLDAKPFEALAYQQAVAVLRGDMDLAQALEDARKYTRRYAKRQWTWFRREPGVVWLDGFGDDAALQLSAIEIIEMRLSPFRC
jgi:tRNA dimethylallyltransferase